MRSVRSIIVFSPLLWGITAAQSAVIAIWGALSPRFSFDFSDLAPTWTLLTLCLMIALVLSWWETERPLPAVFDRLRTAVVGLIYLTVTFTGIRLLHYLTMSLAFPLADDLLDSWDKAIGFDWTAYAMWLAQYREWMPYAQIPYYRTPGFCALLFIALVFIGRTERAREFATLLIVGALISIVIGSLMPAEAAMVRYDDGRLLQIFGANAGVYHMETLQALRGTGNIALTFGNMPGLITFPSYHTITGLLFAYACRDSLYTFVPAALWTAVMLITTPVYGGHYLIDVLAGGAVTLALIAWGAKAESFRVMVRRPALPVL